MILAEPLARALVRIGGKTMPHMDTWAVPVLAALRADPATLAALAEAMWKAGIRSEPEYGTVDEAAAALADALFGAP